jgi:hypothetical protein
MYKKTILEILILALLRKHVYFVQYQEQLYNSVLYGELNIFDEMLTIENVDIDSFVT